MLLGEHRRWLAEKRYSKFMLHDFPKNLHAELVVKS